MLGKYRQNAPENKNRPAEGGAVDKTGWVRYTIDEKGTTSKAVPQSYCKRSNRNWGVWRLLLFVIMIFDFKNQGDQHHKECTEPNQV